MPLPLILSGRSGLFEFEGSLKAGMYKTIQSSEDPSGRLEGTKAGKDFCSAVRLDNRRSARQCLGKAPQRKVFYSDYRYTCRNGNE